MSELRSLRDLLLTELKDLHSAESYLLEALPRLAKTAATEEARAGFQERFEETRLHVKRLESAIQSLDAPASGESRTSDMEDFELAGYGTVRNFAELMEIIEITESLRGSRPDGRDTRVGSGMVHALACG